MSESFKSFDDIYNSMGDLENLRNNLLETFKPSKPADLKYQGLDVLGLAKTFWNNAKNLSKDKMMIDILDLITIGLMRGNIREDQLVKTSASGIEKIKVLIDRYKIPMRKNASDKIKLSSTTLTFVRILSVFPMHTTFFLHHKPNLCNRLMSYDFGGNNCPVALRHSGAADIIPTGLAGSFYMLAHISYMMDFSLLIDKRNISAVERFENQRRFAAVAQNSPTISQVQRIALFKVLNLDHVEVFNKVLVCVNNLRKLEGKTVYSNVEDTGIKVVNDKIVMSDDVKLEEESNDDVAMLLKSLSESASLETLTPAGPSGTAGEDELMEL